MPEPRSDYDDSDIRTHKPSLAAQMARYSELALALPACTFAGWLLGYVLDKWLGTKFFFIIGLLCGIAAGFVELVRTVLKSET